MFFFKEKIKKLLKNIKLNKHMKKTNKKTNFALFILMILHIISGSRYN
tara:strand:- start:1479 stop:1622 length:144 start_codon:yes stop_codon:yes gene_type:complete